MNIDIVEEIHDTLHTIGQRFQTEIPMSAFGLCSWVAVLMMIKLISRGVGLIAISWVETTGNIGVEQNHEHLRSQDLRELSGDKSLLLLQFLKVTPWHCRRPFDNNATSTIIDRHPEQHLSLQGIRTGTNGRNGSILDLRAVLLEHLGKAAQRCIGIPSAHQ